MRNLAWLLIPIALVLGVAFGLHLAWNVWSGGPTQGTIADMRRFEKERYLRLIAAAYAADGNYLQARQRVEQLNPGNPAQWVADQAVLAERSGQLDSARHLARLAYAMGSADPTTVRISAFPTGTPVIAPSPTPIIAPPTPRPLQ